MGRHSLDRVQRAAKEQQIAAMFARLRTHCEQQHMTAYRLSHTTGMSLSLAQALMRGDMKDPSWYTIARAAHVLGLSLDMLAGHPLPPLGEV